MVINKAGGIRLQAEALFKWQSLQLAHGHHFEGGISLFMHRKGRAEMAQGVWDDEYGSTSY